MTASEAQANSLPAAENKPGKLRWFHPTPGRLLVVLLAVEGILLLSEPWFPKGWAVLVAIAAVGAFLIAMLLWFVISLIFHRRFQFSIRSLLLLTVVVAVLCGWFAAKMEEAKRQREAVDALRKLGGIVQGDDYYERAARIISAADAVRKLGGAVQGNDYYERVTRIRSSVRGQSPISGWLRRALGDDWFIDVINVYLSPTYPSPSKVNDSDLKYLERFTRLRAVKLDRTQVTDAGLEHLNGLAELQYLFLDETQVTDAGVAKLQKALPNCHIER